MFYLSFQFNINYDAYINSYIHKASLFAIYFGHLDNQVQALCFNLALCCISISTGVVFLPTFKSSCFGLLKNSTCPSIRIIEIKFYILRSKILDINRYFRYARGTCMTNTYVASQPRERVGKLLGFPFVQVNLFSKMNN